MSRTYQDDRSAVIKEILTSQHFAVIATESNHQPYTSLVSFVSSPDIQHIYFPTKKETQKYLNIKINTSIAILIDNRENTPSDLSNAITVTALGSAQEIINEKESIKKLFLQKHPELSDFLSEPSCILIDVSVETYQIVQKFGLVQILHIRDVQE